MNRNEALHILGLNDDATADDIKIAYRETVQILHPDKFAGNEKLQTRATEQFKRLQEAYELLCSSTGRRGRGSSSSAASNTSGAARSWTETEGDVEVEYLTEAEIRDAIRRPVGARSVSAVKMRTRAGMGRCQGGFCSPRVLEILCEELGLDPLEVTQSGGRSNILVGRACEPKEGES